MQALQPQPSLVRRQIEQLQQSVSSGRLPPHLSGTPLRPRLARARTNLDVVWSSLEHRRPPQSASPAAAAWAFPGGGAGQWAVPAPQRSPRGTRGPRLCGVAGVAPQVSRSFTHLHQVHLSELDPVRLPLRAIQGSQCTHDSGRAAKTAPRGRAGRAAADAVYQTIEPAEPPHYDKPVSPPVPVDASKRKRKAKAERRGRPEDRLLDQPRSVEAKEAPGALRLRPLAPQAPQALDTNCGHRTLPRRLTGAGISVVDIDIDVQRLPGSGHGVGPSPERAGEGGPDGPESELTKGTTPTSTLPLKKAARAGQLWRRFSSFNPCSRWDDWNNASRFREDVSFCSSKPHSPYQIPL